MNPCHSFIYNGRCSQDELRSRNRELEELEQAVKQRQWELEQRSAQITQIDRQVRERHSDLEKQVTTLDSSLKKAQHDLRSKDKKVSIRSSVVFNL